MHAVGGTDEYDQIIPLVPALPYAFKKFFSNKDSTIPFGSGDNKIEVPWQQLTSAQMMDVDDRDRGIYTRLLDKFIEEEKAHWGNELEINSNHIVLVAPRARAEKQYMWFLGTGMGSENPEEDEKYVSKRKRILQDEINECVSFAAIADKVPYLGQFLCDFSFFDAAHSNLLSSVDPIYDILNKMRVNNTWLKIYTPSYYSLLYDLVKTNAAIEGLAEQYEAEWRLAVKKINDKTFDPTAEYGAMERANSYIEQINNLLTREYFDHYLEVYGTSKDKYKAYNLSL